MKNLHIALLSLWFSIATLDLSQAETQMDATPASDQTLSTATFNLNGTPLLSRMLEIKGLVWREDLITPIKNNRQDIQILPSSPEPKSISATPTTISIPTAEKVAQGTMVFTPRPTQNSQLELQLLMKLQGISHQNPTHFRFNSTSGQLIVKSTPGELAKFPNFIINPPTNALAYLKSLSPLD